MREDNWKLRPLLEVFLEEGVSLAEDEYFMLLNAITNMPGWKSMSVADQRRYRDGMWRVSRARNRRHEQERISRNTRIEQLKQEFLDGFASRVDGDMRNLKRWGGRLDNRS